MYTPIELTATNFQSFENLNYSFLVGKSLLIQGENLTDDGQKSNGSGKSTFGEIIYYCLLGSSSSGKRDVKLIRRGSSESNISITFQNSIDGSVLKIERTLFLKRSATLNVYVNSVNQKDKFPSVGEGNKFILQLLDVSSDDLKNFYLINKDRFTPFFKYSDTEARDFISRFINIKRLDSIINSTIPKEIEELNDNIKFVEDELKGVEDKILVEETKITTNEEQIVTIEEGNNEKVFKEKKAESLLKINSEIELLESEEKIIKKKYDDSASILSDYEKELNFSDRLYERINNIDYNKKQLASSETLKQLDLKEKNYKAKIKEHEQEITQLLVEIKPCKDAVLGTISCPQCSHEFNPGSEIDLEEARVLIKETDEYIESLNKTIEDIKIKIIKEVEEERKKINEENQIYVVKNNKKLQKLNSISSTQRQLRSKRSSEDLILKGIGKDLNLKATEISTKKVEKEILETSTMTNISPIINEIRKSISESKSKIEELIVQKDECNSLKQELLDNVVNKQTWIINFKQFLVYLTNKSLLHIQGLCNNFLEKIDTDLRIKIEGFKYLSDGSTKDKITVNVLRGEVEEEDYRCFSGGEKGKLIFSTILAFQSLINNNSKSGGLDLLLIDEILDSVDGVGMSSFISALNNLNKTILLTTHINTEEKDENVLLIKKVNNKSYVVN